MAGPIDVPAGWEVIDDSVPAGWEIAEDAPPAPVSSPATPAPTVVDRLNAPFRAAAQTLTLGAADEIGGFLGAGVDHLAAAVGLGEKKPFGQRLNDSIDEYRRQDAAGAAANPVGTAFGTAASMVAPVGAIGAATSTAGKLATSAGLGAAGGFLGAEGTAAERVPGAIAGGAVGLGLGAVAAGKGPALVKKAAQLAKNPGDILKLPGGRGAAYGGALGGAIGEPASGAAIGGAVELAGRGVVKGVQAGKAVYNRLKPAPAPTPAPAPPPAAPDDVRPATTGPLPASLKPSAEGWKQQGGRPQIVPDDAPAAPAPAKPATPVVDHSIQSKSGKTLQETGRTYTAREDKALKLLEDNGGTATMAQIAKNRTEFQDGMLKLTYRGLAHWDKKAKVFRIGRPNEGGKQELFMQRLQQGIKDRMQRQGGRPSVVPDTSAAPYRGIEFPGGDDVERMVKPEDLADAVLGGKPLAETADSGLSAGRLAKVKQGLTSGKAENMHSFEPVRVVVSPKGKLEVEGGRHRILAARELGIPLKVRYQQGSAGMDE